jgi:hypothetical protein
MMKLETSNRQAILYKIISLKLNNTLFRDTNRQEIVDNSIDIEVNINDDINEQDILTFVSSMEERRA